MFQPRCPIKTSPAEFYVSKDSSAEGVFFQITIVPIFLLKAWAFICGRKEIGKIGKHILTGCPVYDIMRSNRTSV